MVDYYDYWPSILLTAGDDDEIFFAPLSPRGPLGGSDAEGDTRDLLLWGVFGRNWGA